MLCITTLTRGSELVSYLPTHNVYAQRCLTVDVQWKLDLDSGVELLRSVNFIHFGEGTVQALEDLSERYSPSP